MIDMVRTAILPAVSCYKKTLADTCISAKQYDAEAALPYEEETLGLLSKYSGAAYHSLRTLEDAMKDDKKPVSSEALAAYCSDIILPLMEELRCEIDAMEPLVPKNVWPYPSYADILFYE